MKIELEEVPIRELVKNFSDNGEGGVVGYGGKLDIRPPYQREFVYDDKKRAAVIDTISKDFPLNIMYWVKKPDGTFEILDGQQRTISICQYYNDDFTVDYLGFTNLPDDRKNQFLDYTLTVYICEGTESEKLDWFRTVNIAGEKLTDQELRNAVYAGPWLTDAKRYFSRSNGPAYGLASKYMNGSPIRQDYLETTLKWINKGEIEAYMASHQHDKNANELWAYFTQVINWVEMLFPPKYYRKEMKGIAWGDLYNQFKPNSYDATDFEMEILPLMQDDEVKNKKGIYEYIFTGNEKHLNLRAFTPSQKREAYERQDGHCANVNCPTGRDHKFNISEMEGDHITPWREGGKTTMDNLQMLCKDCNRRKGAR